MKNATSIQQEMYVNGSVEVLFALQTDLYAYAGGVYIVSYLYQRGLTRALPSWIRDLPADNKTQRIPTTLSGSSDGVS